MADQDLQAVTTRYHDHLISVEDPVEGEAGKFLRSRGIEYDTWTRFLLGEVNPVPGHERYRGMLSIPYRDALGRVTALKFRNLGEGEKYLNPPGSRMVLFNIGATDNDVVYVVEGELDAVLLEQLGVHAVGVPGVNHWRPHWRWLFRDCSEVVLIPDRDDKGQSLEAFRRMEQDLSKMTTVRPVSLPPGHDVGSLYQEDPKAVEAML